jgi:hypothetical protein
MYIIATREVIASFVTRVHLYIEIHIICMIVCTYELVGITFVTGASVRDRDDVTVRGTLSEAITSGALSPSSSSSSSSLPSSSSLLLSALPLSLFALPLPLSTCCKVRDIDIDRDVWKDDDWFGNAAR